MYNPILDDDEDMYIPDVGEVDEEIDLHGAYPRSNAGIALNWSPLEQQMFDMLLLNRFSTYDREILDEVARTISRLVETFEAHEIARIMAVAMLSFQLAAAEDKSFEDEYNRYIEYILKHPEDIEGIQSTSLR